MRCKTHPRHHPDRGDVVLIEEESYEGFTCKKCGQFNKLAHAQEPLYFDGLCNPCWEIEMAEIDSAAPYPSLAGFHCEEDEYEF